MRLGLGTEEDLDHIALAKEALGTAVFCHAHLSLVFFMLTQNHNYNIHECHSSRQDLSNGLVLRSENHPCWRSKHSEEVREKE